MSGIPPGTARSFLKWAGGKTRYAAALARLAPPYTGRYWEPFMGSAALFFELAPRAAVLADANEELVACFQEVAEHPYDVMEELERMPNTRDYYGRARGADTRELGRAARAARVIYLNKTGFRGLWRVNRKGEFNVPYGQYERPYYNAETLLCASRALASAEIRLADYSECLAGAAVGDWVYLDPPYVPLGGHADFKRYTPGQFHEEDHRNLARLMREASDRGVYIMLTNADTPLAREIFAGFAFLELSTRRDINLQSSRRASSDLVVSNYLGSPAVHRS